MFEHILLESTGGNKRKKLFSIVISTVTQCLVVAGLIISPLLFTEGLPRAATFARRWVDPGLPPSPGPQNPARVAPGAHSQGGVSVFRPKVEGSRPDFRPIGIDTSDPGPIDIGPAPEIGPGSDGGVIGGVPNGTSAIFRTTYEAPPPPVEKKHQQEGPIHITKIENAQILYRPQPEYPSIARQMRQQGIVRLEAIISRDGLIEDLKVISGHPLLVRAALDAVRQWRYRPTMLNGQAVEVITTIEVTFTLN